MVEGSSICECGVCVEIDKKVCGLLKVKEDAAEVRARVEVLSSRRGLSCGMRDRGVEERNSWRQIDFEAAKKINPSPVNK